MSGNNIGIIYGLICPITNTIRYVGQTTQVLNKRFIQHKTCSIKAKTYLGSWLRKLKEMNLLEQLEIIVLERCAVEKLIERETYYITLYNLKGYKLTNLEIRDIRTNRRVLSKEQLKKRIALTKKVHIGLKRSDETRLNMSKARKIYLANNINPHRGRTCSENTKKLMSSLKRKTEICSIDFKGNIKKRYESINSVKYEGLSVGNVYNCLRNKQLTYNNSFWRKISEPYITKENISDSILYILFNIETKEIIIDYPKKLAEILSISRYRVYRAAADNKLLLNRYKVINNICDSEIELGFILHSIGVIK